MIFEKVQNVIVEQLGVDKEDITLESKIKEELAADSLDAVEIAITLEDMFDMEISDEELAKFVTVGDIVNFIDNEK